jgi:hypothetical protein
VFIGNASLLTSGQDKGISVVVGSGKATETVLVLIVVGRTLIVEVGTRALLDIGGVSWTRFAVTSLSKSAF